MSFYSMLFGKNINTPIVLALIKLKETDISRFRDCFIDGDRISIYARTGGYNREDYPQDNLINSPYYLSDEDDEDDNTYATYYFKYPDEIAEDITNMLSGNGISKKLLDWIQNVIYRQPTHGDVMEQFRRQQVERVTTLQRDMKLSEAFNGHTVIPLSDDGLELMFGLTEEADGEFLAYWWLAPYQIIVQENGYRFKNMKDTNFRRLWLETNWEVDEEAWQRYQDKFSEKYPKSMAKMRELVERKKDGSK